MSSYQTALVPLAAELARHVERTEKEGLAHGGDCAGSDGHCAAALGDDLSSAHDGR